MKTSPPAGMHSVLFVLTASLLAFSPAGLRAAAADDASSRSLTALDDKAPQLPLTPTFDKGTDPEAGPYVLNLKNDSKDALVVNASIHLSVAFHANKKDRKIANHSIEAGQTWTIPDLAAGDKITLTAEGYAPLELTVP